MIKNCRVQQGESKKAVNLSIEQQYQSFPVWALCTRQIDVGFLGHRSSVIGCLFEVSFVGQLIYDQMECLYYILDS